MAHKNIITSVKETTMYPDLDNLIITRQHM